MSGSGAEVDAFCKASYGLLVYKMIKVAGLACRADSVSRTLQSLRTIMWLLHADVRHGLWISGGMC